MKDSLSSPWTKFQKWTPVVFWLVFIGIFAHAVVVRDPDRVVALIMLSLVTPFLAVLFARMWRLMDLVAIKGSDLLLRRGGTEHRVPLADVMSVWQARLGPPAIAYIRLRHKGPFGDEVGFSPRWSAVSTWSLRLVAVETLMMAADAAKLDATK